MAYPTRGRDPFLDAGTQAFLERRGVEALGLFVSAVGVAFALALASYAPEDSAWISAGGPEIQNWLGQIGAIVAAPLIKIMHGSRQLEYCTDIFGMGPAVDRAYRCGPHDHALDLCANFLGAVFSLRRNPHTYQQLVP